MAFPIALIPVILQVLSALPGLIVAAEQAFSRSGSGAQKKEFVTNAVGTALDVATSVAKIRELEVPGAKSAVVSAAGSLTDAIVQTYNVIGYFRHGGDPTDVTASGGH